MMHRYLQFQPLYADPDLFCSITVGSGRVWANIQIYLDEYTLQLVAQDLVTESLEQDTVARLLEPEDEIWFGFYPLVESGPDDKRILRFKIYQLMLDDEAPYVADIRFVLSPEEANDLSKELKNWLERPEYCFTWKD